MDQDLKQDSEKSNHINQSLNTVKQPSNKKKRKKLIVVCGFMFTFAFLLIPFYEAICEITGINVLASGMKLDEKPKNTQVNTNRLVNVDFDANIHGKFHFKPSQTTLKIHPGQIYTVYYTVKNTENKPLVVQSIPSYSPSQTAKYFKKIECFCFEQQAFKPLEEKKLPLVFVIDNNLPKNLDTITLSYTFFEVNAGNLNKKSFN